MSPTLDLFLLQFLNEREAQHANNLRGWREPDGYLLPTEPDEDERRLVRAQLEAAIHEIREVRSYVERHPVYP